MKNTRDIQFVDKVIGALRKYAEELEENKVKEEIGKENAEHEYKKFKENRQKTIGEGDFEKAIKKLENKNYFLLNYHNCFLQILYIHQIQIHLQALCKTEEFLCNDQDQL